MKTLVLTVGDEVTSGHIPNGNAAWIAREIETVGLTPERIVTVRDDEQTLAAEVKAALTKYAVVIVTGGLGPTHDDVTKAALCRGLGVPLVRDPRALVAVKRFFKKLGKEMPPVNLGQADIPKGAEPLYNRIGTAPGIFFDTGKSMLFALPGVPAEMQALMTQEVIPILRKRASTVVIERCVMHTLGIGESTLYEMMGAVGLTSPEGIELAFLPRIGEVDIRLTAKAPTKEVALARLRDYRKDLKKVIAPWYYGKDEKSLEQVIARRFVKLGVTLASAESCTGGLFAATMIALPGASDYFIEGLVAYSNASKIKRLGVREKTLAECGAVSEEVAAQMAKGVRKKLDADIGISATGVAGPGGGTPEKPVGLVYVGLAMGDEVKTKKLQFGFDRVSNQRRTVREMLVWLFFELKDYTPDPEEDETS
jgi:nicotinamide-nucleotide amidase